MRSALLAPVLALLLSPLLARAGELSLLEIAVTERDERAAVDRVDTLHGSKPPQELSAGERGEIIREQQAASRAVFEEKRIDPKAFALRVMRLTPQERAQVNEEKRRMDQEEADRRAREAEAKVKAESEEPEVVRGIDEKHPVDLYRDPDTVEIENLQEDGAAPAAAPAPAKPKKAHKPARPPSKSSRGAKTRRK